VIKFAVDPPLHRALDVGEVGHHVAAIERVGLDLQLHDGVVPVRVFADAVVVEQPVAVAELQPLGHRVHSL
jgi:hypothetical protein